jgi:hypothetical protein
MAIVWLWSMHKCWNTEQMLKHSAETELELMLMVIAEMTQMVKVVIDGNRLVMEHAQVLEHRS